MKRSKYIFSALCIGSLLLSSCSKKGCTDYDANNYESKAKKDDGSCVYDPEIILKFHYVVKEDDLVLNSGNYICWKGHEYNVTRLQHIVSNLKIYKKGGGYETITGAWYFDAADDATLTANLGQISSGDYTGVGFTWGLEDADNVAGTFSSGAAKQNMLRVDSLGGGYDFMRLEGQYDYMNTDTTLQDFDIRVGSVSPFYFADFEVGPIYAYSVTGGGIENPKQLTFDVEFDLNWWFELPNTYDFSEYPGSIVLNTDAQQKLKDNAQEYVFELSRIIKE